MDDSMLLVTCPHCGKRLCKAKPGSDLETECPKCKYTIIVVIDVEHRVTIQFIQPVSA